MDLLAASSSSGLATPSGFISSSFSHRRRRKLPHFFLNGSTSAAKKEEKTALRTSRRSFVFFLLFPMPIALSPSLSDALSPTLLERYTDEINGFTLLKPSTWAQTEKAGADVLFEEEKGSNNIGVVVSPVRISSLKDFGTAEFTAEKLIQAERRKYQVC